MSAPDLAHLRRLLARAQAAEAGAIGTKARMAVQRAWVEADMAAAQALPGLLDRIEELERENADLRKRLADLREEGTES